ncbi:MAG: hypothetical protein A2Z20_00670 [Bdellovibrionales bacterium RBG_16_40_8]|nr:MAG: hypothetical protein A2Z20_00670 [Bdellovibrionales bacterium RBG_16_40_8]
MNAILLSAGLGTRFRPTTEKIAKPAIPFLNVPLLSYMIYYFEKMGLDNLVLNTHHLPKIVEAAARHVTHKQNYHLQFSFESKILGSGGGIKNAEKLLRAKDDFLVANGDEIILFNHNRGFLPLLEFHKKNKALATLLTSNHPHAGKTLGGVWSDSNHQITNLGEIDLARSGAQHFTGVFVFSPKIFSFMPDGKFHIFKDCLHKAMSSGEKVLSYHDDNLLWLDTSSENDYLQSTREALAVLDRSSVHASTLTQILKRFGQNFVQTGNKQWLCPGAKFTGALDPDSYLFMGPKSEVGPDVKISGFAVIRDHVTFDHGLIENSVIAQASSNAQTPNLIAGNYINKLVV